MFVDRAFMHGVGGLVFKANVIMVLVCCLFTATKPFIFCDFHHRNHLRHQARPLGPEL
jgi:hypothetical protein